MAKKKKHEPTILERYEQAKKARLHWQRGTNTLIKPGKTTKTPKEVRFEFKPGGMYKIEDGEKLVYFPNYFEGIWGRTEAEPIEAEPIEQDYPDPPDELSPVDKWVDEWKKNN